jgi:hypothetical protein
MWAVIHSDMESLTIKQFATAYRKPVSTEEPIDYMVNLNNIPADIWQELIIKLRNESIKMDFFESIRELL